MQFFNKPSFIKNSMIFQAEEAHEEDTTDKDRDDEDDEGNFLFMITWEIVLFKFIYFL